METFVVFKRGFKVGPAGIVHSVKGVEVKDDHIAVVIGEKIVDRGGERIVGDGFGQLLDNAFFVFNAERVEELGEQKDFGELIDICESGGRAV